MNWVDFMILVLVALLTYGGTRRGFVLEFADLVVLAGGTLVTLHIYRDLARFCIRTLKWHPDLATVVAFWVIFLPVATVLYLVFLALDKAAKVPAMKLAHQIVGGILAFPKSLILAWILLLLFTFFPLAESTRKNFRESPTAGIVRGLTPAVEGLVQGLAPAEVGKAFLQRIRRLSFKEVEPRSSRK